MTDRVTPRRRPAGQSGSRQARPAANPTAAPQWSVQQIAKAAVAVGALLVALIVMVYGSYLVMYKPEADFRQEAAISYDYARDALSESAAPNVPVAEIFSEENRRRFEEGRGLVVTFTIRNYQLGEYEYGDKTVQVELPAFTRYAEVVQEERLKQIADKQQELDAAVAEFQAPIPLTEVIEIFADDTSGITAEHVAWANQRLGMAGIQSELKPASGRTKIFFFRLSDTDYLNYREVTIEPATDDATAQAHYQDGLNWVLEPRPARQQSSIATGLFNALKLNQLARKRRIIILSDGMENAMATTSFLAAANNPSILNPDNYEHLDRLITLEEGFPRLTYARVNWYFPPDPRDHVRAVMKYWEHVLRARCSARSVETIF